MTLTETIVTGSLGRTLMFAASRCGTHAWVYKDEARSEKDSPVNSRDTMMKISLFQNRAR
jgi:hypothetical protein